MSHDAIRAATLLREIIASDRTRVGFLIGAGCPYSIPKPGSACAANVPGAAWEGLIPNVDGLTTLVLNGLAVDHEPHSKTLTDYLANRGLISPNIEVILSHVRSLADVVGNGNVHGFDKDCLDFLESYICNKITIAVSEPLPDVENGYASLSNWIKGLSRVNPVEIFTTNYDLLIERALESERISTFDGFTGSHNPFFDVSAVERDGLPVHWVRVWKLHGSINWRSGKKASDVHRTSEIGDTGNSLIHPSHRKYDQSRRLPYLALIDRLKLFMKQPSAVLFISGYSFGDDHINEAIVDGLDKNPTALVAATLYGSLSTYKTAMELSKKSPNLLLLAEDQAVIGKKQAVWNYDPDQSLAALRHVFNTDFTNKSGWIGGNAEFLLGNFASMGKFLDDVSGSFRQVERVARP